MLISVKVLVFAQFFGFYNAVSNFTLFSDAYCGVVIGADSIVIFVLVFSLSS